MESKYKITKYESVKHSNSKPIKIKEYWIERKGYLFGFLPYWYPVKYLDLNILSDRTVKFDTLEDAQEYLNKLNEIQNQE